MTTPWISLYNGADYNLFGDPPSSPPPIETIAHSLATINRFTGHAIRPYSVAEHSCLCLEIVRRTMPEADPLFTLAVLCHDAAECITGDLSSPMKRALGEPWKEIESAIEERVITSLYPGLYHAFNFHHDEIRRVDLTALWIERRDILRPHTRKWEVLDNPSFEPISCKVKIFPTESHWTFWREKFLYHFRTLVEEIQKSGN